MVLGIATSFSGMAMAQEDTRTGRELVDLHAEESLHLLESHESRVSKHPADKPGATSTAPSNDPREQPHHRTAKDVLIGHGHGDLSKGTLVCQRISELAARADLAKQIRVLVKERATDRIRERTGREPEQDIEVVREEIVQEYLQGVKIVDRRLDEQHKTCSATAVMPMEPPPGIPRIEREPAALTTH
jgi:hypothetical protein